MLRIPEYSITHFCEHILRLRVEKSGDIGGELYGASIPIEGTKGNEYDFHLFFPEEALKKFADVLISDHKFKEDNWCDLTKECVNRIISHAKNLLNDAKGEDEYKLGIPEYLSRIDFSTIRLDESLTYSIDNYNFRIGSKEYE